MEPLSGETMRLNARQRRKYDVRYPGVAEGAPGGGPVRSTSAVSRLWVETTHVVHFSLLESPFPLLERQPKHIHRRGKG